MFPNITDVQATTTRDEPLPIFDIIFFVVLSALFLTDFIWMKRHQKRRGYQPVHRNH
jgi:DMSO/TMAO reductase YedYZ heme-binding membrane subunit